MDKLQIQRCRELIAAIRNGSARRKDELELCELSLEALSAAQPIDFDAAATEAAEWVKRFESLKTDPAMRVLVISGYAAGAVRAGKS